MRPIPFQLAYLLLGTNLGDRSAILRRSCQKIEARCGHIQAHSQIWRTASWGIEDQPDFLNLCIAVRTGMTAAPLLRELLAIELEIGRVRRIKWASRLIDIDILLFGQEVIDRPQIKVPHPFMTERNFALGPLSDIAGEMVHPVHHKTIRQLYRECTDPLEAEPVTAEIL